MTAEAPSALERGLKIAAVALTLFGLLVGAHQFAQTQAVEAARPFLERKLKWCEEAVEVAAGIAVYGRDSALPTIAPAPAVRRADRFWTLYWGVMGMVEGGDVTAAMIRFGEGLKSATSVQSDNSRSLDIAHACRNEMAHDWSPAWRR